MLADEFVDVLGPVAEYVAHEGAGFVVLDLDGNLLAELQLGGVGHRHCRVAAPGTGRGNLCERGADRVFSLEPNQAAGP